MQYYLFFCLLIVSVTCSHAVDDVATETCENKQTIILEVGHTEIFKVGERINNLARAFNVREGFTRSDDTLPERLMTEPLQSGASKGHIISKEDLKQMLDEYYTARGWDLTTGIPTREKLSELGLGYVVEQLKV